MKKQKLVLIGCGGHARSVADVYLFNNPDCEIVFVDKNAQPNETSLGFSVVKSYTITDEDVFIGIGDNSLREEEFKKYKKVCSIISKKAYIGHNVTIGDGVFVAHNAHVGVNSIIKNNVIVNSSASIDHDCVVGNNTHIAPNSTLCGTVKIGDNVFVCAGSTVINNTSVCSNVTLAAGAVAIKDIKEPGTYVGVPAKLVKT